MVMFFYVDHFRLSLQPPRSLSPHNVKHTLEKSCDESEGVLSSVWQNIQDGSPLPMDFNIGTDFEDYLA